jgi:predicted transcriptional regulator
MAGSMRYRSRTDIVYQILEIANGSTSKTRIMYGAYLSYTQLKEYLALLIENGLLEQETEKKYRTTPKGLQFIKSYSQIGQMVSI